MVREEESFLQDVTEKIKKRIEKIDQTLLTGQKEIENMHDYYWENYTEMDQYGYEDYDNQQALLSQVNANQESRFRIFRGNRKGTFLYRNWKFCRGGGKYPPHL